MMLPKWAAALISGTAALIAWAVALLLPPPAARAGKRDEKSKEVKK